MAILTSMGRRRRLEEEGERGLAQREDGRGETLSAAKKTAAANAGTGQAGPCAEGGEGAREGGRGGGNVTTVGSGGQGVRACAAQGVIVASRVSPEKHAAVMALLEEEGSEGGVGEYGWIEYKPVPRLLILRPHGREEGKGGVERRKPPSIGEDVGRGRCIAVCPPPLSPSSSLLPPKHWLAPSRILFPPLPLVLLSSFFLENIPPPPQVSSPSCAPGRQMYR